MCNSKDSKEGHRMEEDTVFIKSNLAQEKLQYPKQPRDGGKVLTTRRVGHALN